MGPEVFLDTNIIIDYLTDRKPFAIYSSQLFELHEQQRIKIYISALSINTVYYISRKILGEKPTLNLIYNLINDLEVLGTSKDEIKKAFHTGFKDFKDFEDSIQYTTATKIDGIEAIITRNTKDYKKSKIAIFTPELFLQQLDYGTSES